MNIGYMRVCPDQNLSNDQTNQLNTAECDRVFSDTHNGLACNRPGLCRALMRLKRDDTFIITDYPVLAIRTLDAVTILDEIKSKGAQLRVLRDSPYDIHTPSGLLYVTLQYGFSQFNYETENGMITVPRSPKPGPAHKLTFFERVQVRRLLSKGVSQRDIAHRFNVSPMTISRIAKWSNNSE